MPKRSRSNVRANYARVTSVSRMGRARAARASYKKRKTLATQVGRLMKTIETKEGTRRITNLQLAHNNLIVLNDVNGNPYNPFLSIQGAGDPMGASAMDRLGDEITVQNLSIKFFLETSLSRSNVHFRFFFVKMAKGDTLSRVTFFKDCCGNKMIDQINTERFTVLATKTVTVKTDAEAAPSALGILTGVPTANVPGIGGTRIISMKIPGRKFGRRGVVTYENSSQSQVKFYDYRLCCVAYDWYGTPQDVNNVGFINDGYAKLYFKDA